MGSDGRNSNDERKLNGVMSEKQSLPPPASAATEKSSGLHPSVYIAYGLHDCLDESKEHVLILGAECGLR